ncbi:MAG: hypothetical protein ACE5KT_10775 [Methanosarcinales archaeon]
MNLSRLRKRTREENDHTLVTIFGGAVVGGVIFGPTGALIGGIIGAVIGEYGNEHSIINILIKK